MIGIELEEAIDILLTNVKDIQDIERKGILDALGYILAEDIYAGINNPPYDRSPLDGFALNHTSTKNCSRENPVHIHIEAEVMAGDYYEKIVEENSGVRIMTGAPIPRGCNCVIKQEEVEYSEDIKILKVYKELKEYENFCFEGEDFLKGELMIEKGSLLTPNHIGVLASLGTSEVLVYRKPVVGVLITGDELVQPGRELTSGKIYNSNLFTLAAKLKKLGVEVKCYPHIADETNTVADFILEKIKDVDLFITTGGVSVGKKDIMHDVIEVMNGKRLFWRVNIQPGTPVLASLHEKKILLSLSGNPFAAMVNFELLARPVLHKLSRGMVGDTVRKKCVVSEGEFPKKTSRRRFVRARYINDRIHLTSSKHSSGQISSTLDKNAIIDIKSGTPWIKKGDVVEVLVIDE